MLGFALLLLLVMGRDASRGVLSLDFLDCHHHFYDTKQNEFQSFLGRFNLDVSYLPEDCDHDVVQSIEASEVLSKKGLHHFGSVHVEAMPDDGTQEVAWVESLLSSSEGRCTVKAFVASCDLARENVDANLKN